MTLRTPRRLPAAHTCDTCRCTFRPGIALRILWHGTTLCATCTLNRLRDTEGRYVSTTKRTTP